ERAMSAGPVVVGLRRMVHGNDGRAERLAQLAASGDEAAHPLAILITVDVLVQRVDDNDRDELEHVADLDDERRDGAGPIHRDARREEGNVEGRSIDWGAAKVAVILAPGVDARLGAERSFGIDVDDAAALDRPSMPF